MSAQLKLSIIPEYTDSRLYHNLQKVRGKFVSNSGYNDSKVLVFYKSKEPLKPDGKNKIMRTLVHVEKNAIMRIVFPDFRSAYEYILNNSIKNFNIEYGCYEKEIEQYQKEITYNVK